MESRTSIFPIWAIIVIVVLVIILVTIAVFFIRRRRSRLLSVDTIPKNVEEEEVKGPKLVSSILLQELGAKKSESKQQNNDSSSTFVSISLPLTSNDQQQQQESPQLNFKIDKFTSISDESEDDDYSSPELLQEIKISLPLPPPSISFFSNKMELTDNGVASNLFDMHFSKEKTEQNSNGFISIDLDSTNSHLNTNSMTQQKKLSITTKTSPYEEDPLKIQSKLCENPEQQTARKSEEINYLASKHYPITITDDDSYSLVHKEYNKKESSTLLDGVKKNSLQRKHNEMNEDDNNNKSPATPYYANHKGPVNVVKHVARSVSKKSNSCSMIPMDSRVDSKNSLADKEQDKLCTDLKQSSISHDSIRGRKGINHNNEHMTITSGSMRRFVNESILFNDESLSSIPFASSATLAFERNKAPKKGSVNAFDIVNWFEFPKNSKPSNATAVAVITTDRNSSDNMLPRNISSGENSLTSHTPPQYRASLSTSIFAFNNTLSKVTGSNTVLYADSNHDSISRCNSYKRGTLGRNTLRSITASATNGVNRSLKGLFDNVSSNSVSHKVAPNDSQKTELISNSSSHAMEGKTSLEQSGVNCYSSRRESIRTSTSRPRSSLSAPYLNSLESSTKYALNDEDRRDKNEILDESSQKTAIEENIRKSSSLSSSRNSTHLSQASGNETRAISSVLTASDESNPHINKKTSFLDINNTGEVDTIRRMLQETWIKNLKESGSTYSMLSETGSSIITISTQQIGSNTLVVTKPKTQSFISESISINELDDSTPSKPFLPENHHKNERDLRASFSFSSSTIHTMVPEQDKPNEPILICHNTAQHKHATSPLTNGSNKLQVSSSVDKSPYPIDQQPTVSVLSEITNSFSGANCSTVSSRAHSRKSSGCNSTATALRISCGYSSGAKTWNGRSQKSFNDKNAVQQFESYEDMYNNIGSESISKRGFYSTMKKGQKVRGKIPWMFDNNSLYSEDEKTPAQIERDKYLEGSQ